jgi:antitoxin Xre/MbcA/ParS-like protein
MKSIAPAVASSTVLTKAVLRAAQALGLSQKRLAAIVGASEASVSRLGRSRQLDPETKEGELALLFLRLFRSLDTLVGGDDDKARAWLWADNSHLGGVPAQRIATVSGLVDAVTYLDALRGKL